MLRGQANGGGACRENGKNESMGTFHNKKRLKKKRASNLQAGDNSMERRAGIAKTLLASAEGPKILGCLWDAICTKLHDDPTRRLVADSNVKVALWIGPASNEKEKKAIVH